MYTHFKFLVIYVRDSERGGEERPFRLWLTKTTGVLPKIRGVETRREYYRVPKIEEIPAAHRPRTFP